MQALTDPRAVRSRKALHDAMLSLLDQKPFADITIRELVAEAGIGYNTFFRHHPSKDALLDEIAAEQISALLEIAVPILDAQDLHAASTALFSYIDEHRIMWTTLITGGAAGRIREEFIKLVRLTTAPRITTQEKVPIDCAMLLIVSGTIELIDWWLRSETPLPPEQVADIFDLVVASPIMTANGYGGLKRGA
ncbi:TetR/AcrR family transcriptional regulator [Zhongshania sp.]|uniref:TetR/AcrR family transcriptional regulator n=1 Tax=Zhongshania sp. TaxID=1971902 RepID=UPI003564AE24